MEDYKKLIISLSKINKLIEIELESSLETLFDTDLSVSGWSKFQHFEHILLVNFGLFSFIVSQKAPEEFKKKSVLGRIVLFTRFIKRGVGKSPKQVAPQLLNASNLEEVDLATIAKLNEANLLRLQLRIRLFDLFLRIYSDLLNTISLNSINTNPIKAYPIKISSEVQIDSYKIEEELGKFLHLDDYAKYISEFLNLEIYSNFKEGNYVFNHPIFGTLTTKETALFIDIHSKHHLKIIRDI